MFFIFFFFPFCHSLLFLLLARVTKDLKRKLDKN